ncbi:ABC transporter substrate-binding protein [Massilia eurypsychrophila]|jgi:putative chitobiose transport system substrate-binding protein|uniref:ABC transporter substrate-binding protein n=1 Tax=Massilia eurypsychrophila TaxID=1485217 RepID=A0A2G8T8Y2_9BURK|nr:sugar ABC transporter substrate-binding protein [Massilia eurypsychrophila]PIL42462.1 ABC transporter substrate-binding protein [Massilia eurypsychrophila]
MFKRRFPAAESCLRAGAMLLIAAAITCPAAAATSQRQTVQFWTMQLSPFNDAYVLGVIAAFEKAHPSVTIRWTDVPWAEMERKTLAALAAKSAPDVVNLNPQFAAKLAEFGALAQPEAYLSADQVAAFLPAVWRANRLDGKTFALPWYLNTNVTLYNRPMLDKAGVAVPANLDELLGAARQLKARSGSYAYFPALDASSPLEALVAMGNPLLDASGCRAGFITAGGERVFNVYRSLYQDGLVPKNVVTEGHRKAVEMFLSGQVAMVSTGMQFLGYIKNSNPGMYSQIGVAGQIGAGGGPASIAAMNVAVMERSAVKPAAFAFAQFLTNPQNQTELARRVPVLPSTSASYDDAFFRQPLADPLLNRARQLSVEQVRRGEVLVPPLRKYSKLRISYARNLQSAMLGAKTAPQALADVGREWQAVLGCAR